MKYLNFLFFFFILFSIYINEDSTNSTENLDGVNQTEVSGELKKLREENNKKFTKKINEYLKELKLDNKKTIAREQFKEIFYKLFEFGRKEIAKEEKEGKKEKKDFTPDKQYINKVFNNLIKEEEKDIKVEQIIDFFEPNNILLALKDSLNDIKLNNKVDSLSETLMHTLNALDEKNRKKEGEKNTDL